MTDALGLTPSQTVGPFLHLGLPWPDGPYVVPADAPDAVRIHGRLLDGAGEPVPDGLIETWQADPDGRFAHPDDPRGAYAATLPGFPAFGRCATDGEGRYAIHTIKPGPVGDGQAPHIDVTVLARGLLDRLVTRIYFPDEQDANAADPVLGGIEPYRRGSLVAVRDGDALRFDIRLQGDDETVFFAV
ncbi:MAG: protocatechuate 3,4-dioxygenase subunit alpha [Streptosporangiales bacterium]